MSRTSKWIGVAAVALSLLIATFVVLLDGKHLRATIARIVTEKTGRALAINGDLQWKLDWPLLRLRATDVTYANPPWATEPLMLSLPAAGLTVSLPRLLRGDVFLPDVQLERPVLHFETAADGRRNWLLDAQQQDDGARALIGRLMIDDGQVRYDDTARKTKLAVAITTERIPSPGTGELRAVFKATGTYAGLPLQASGSGAPVIVVRDDSAPYPYTLVATVGPTSIKSSGTIIGLLSQSGLDADLALRGRTLSEFYELLEMPLPETHAYDVAGHLTLTGTEWRYDEFTGRIGQSEVAGALRVTRGDTRPLLAGELAFQALDLADLGPVVGTEGGAPAATASLRGSGARRATTGGTGALPRAPFRRDRWTTFDTDVKLTAKTILRPQAVPLQQLTTRLLMRDSILTLDPLDFGASGGHIVGVVRLNGQRQPIRAHAKMDARNLQLGKLLPTIALAQESVGQINGMIELTGTGDSVAQMLATADGKVGLVVTGGKTSKLLMEQVTLHVPEMVLQRLAGDRLVDIGCGVADFAVDDGVMKIRTLVLDTEVTKVVGRGTVSLATEALEVTLIPRPKKFSLLALRGPVYVRGSLSDPDVAIDGKRILGRGLAAVALGAINPALSLAALADPGTGKDSDCAALTARAQAPWTHPARDTSRAPGQPATP